MDASSAALVNVTEKRRKKKSEMAEWRRVSCIILWKISMTIETYRANRFPLAIMQMWM